MPFFQFLLHPLWSNKKKNLHFISTSRILHYSPSFSIGEKPNRVFSTTITSNSIYTYRLSCLTFRDPSRARRGPPLQVLEEKIRYSSSISNGAIPLVDCRTWQWTDYTIGHRVVRRAGFHTKDFSNAWASERWVHRCQLCLRLPALGPYSHRGRGVRWNIHDSRIVSERVLNRTKLFARAFFSRESDASNFEILPRIFKGVAIFSFSCFVSLWILSCNLQLINERYSIVFKFFNGNGENSFILKERGNYSEYFKLSSKTGTICF